MSDVAEDIRARAKLLTPEQRRELAFELLDADLDPDIEQAWIDEARRRVAAVDAGQETIAHDEAWRSIVADEG